MSSSLFCLECISWTSDSIKKGKHRRLNLSGLYYFVPALDFIFYIFSLFLFSFSFLFSMLQTSSLPRNTLHTLSSPRSASSSSRTTRVLEELQDNLESIQKEIKNTRAQVRKKKRVKERGDINILFSLRLFVKIKRIVKKRMNHLSRIINNFDRIFKKWCKY